MHFIYFSNSLMTEKDDRLMEEMINFLFHLSIKKRTLKPFYNENIFIKNNFMFRTATLMLHFQFEMKI